MSFLTRQFIKKEDTVEMPAYYQLVLDSDTHLAVWEISEPDTYFLQSVPAPMQVHHPKKLLQHLAGRYILSHLFPDFPHSEILIADTRKPYLPEEQYHFSISHCGDFAAAIASRSCRVGIDIEVKQPKLSAIHPKFIGEREWTFLKALEPEEGVLDLITMTWSVKEALFKWYGLGKVDFKQDMPLVGVPKRISADQFVFPMRFEKEMQVRIDVQVHRFGSLILSYVYSG